MNGFDETQRLAEAILEFELEFSAYDSDVDWSTIGRLRSLAERFLAECRFMEDPRILRRIGSIDPAIGSPPEASRLLAQLRPIARYVQGLSVDPESSTPERISAVFLKTVAGVLGETERGATGQEIVKTTGAFAHDCGVKLPHPDAPLTVNKRTALYDNLVALPAKAQYHAILGLCDHASNDEEVGKVKTMLVAQYGHLAGRNDEWLVSQDLISGTQAWLQAYPDALTPYNAGLAKYQSGALQRNCLDDFRLSLELLIRSVLGNGRSLENQVAPLGRFLKDRGGSPEFRNMFMKLIDYYAKYHNTYIKHGDSVPEKEVEFIIELTSSFSKHLARLCQ